MTNISDNKEMYIAKSSTKFEYTLEKKTFEATAKQWVIKFATDEDEE